MKYPEDSPSKENPPFILFIPAKPVKQRSVPFVTKKRKLIGYAFLLPSLIGFIVLKLYPVLFSLFLSFCEWDLISGWDKIKFIGIQNFINMLDDRYVVSSFSNTLRYVLMVVPGQLVIGIVVAVILEKCVFFKRYFRTTSLCLTLPIPLRFRWCGWQCFIPLWARSIVYSRLLVLLNLPAGYPAVTGRLFYRSNVHLDWFRL